MGQLPKDPSDRLQLVDTLSKVKSRRRKLSDEEDWLKDVLGTVWRGEQTSFEEIFLQAEWLRRLIAKFPLSDAKSVDWLCEAAEKVKKLSDVLETVPKELDPLLERLSIHWQEGENISLDTLARRIDNIQTSLDRHYDEWVQLSELTEKLRQGDLAPLVRMLEAGELASDCAVDEFLYATGKPPLIL